MMVNYNGKMIPENKFGLSAQNRAYKYGDAIFDTLKYHQNEIQFLEDHYFRLLSSMRMLRMKIPMNFTLKYYEDEILKTIEQNNLNNNLRIRVSVHRKDGGLYNPVNQEIDFVIEVHKINNFTYDNYEVELFKDFPVFSGMLSTIKTNNRLINVISSIFASENKYHNSILINEKKNIVEASNANIFLVCGNKVLTPTLQDGCINGIIRNKIIALINDHSDYTLEENSISPFELLKADEVFLTNSITEIQSVDKYRKKIFSTVITKKIRNLFDEKYYKIRSIS